MVSPENLYIVVTALLLLIALGVAIPVLKGIVIDGIERNREGDTTVRSATAEESSPDGSVGPHAVCADCGTPNDPDFSYCRECGARL
ncbi:zinc ribbon domain-containing protein [Natronomonas halophila]|uniref:zinc ribbon domain-containing protein n=1 Tax=Natronomonas halophila TaxID=2747817 RepID=UPI0015B46937|nr:zinc ribbon domain-containing protein [Natronomonas halophila]QLD85468.1 zinc ribbon domain-containing protein [Natronomonas halophila]